MTRHISVDLETLSTAPNARILSIGAVEFDPVAGKVSDNTFYAVIDITAKQGGGVIDASTVVWWMKQSQAARDAIFGADVERVNLPQALIDFSEWLGFNDDLPEGARPDVALWARGNKDEQWLTSAYEGCGFALPYRYWMWNDQRTMTAPFPQFMPPRDTFHVEHNALGDAVYQAHALVNVFARLYSTGAIIGVTHTPVMEGELTEPLGLTDAELGELVDVGATPAPWAGECAPKRD